MSRPVGRLGNLIGPFVRKLIEDVGPLLESYLIALLSQAIAASSGTKTGIAATDGAASGTGSPITPRDLQYLTGLLTKASLTGFAEHIAAKFNQQLMQQGAASFCEGCPTGGETSPEPRSE